MRFLLVHAQLLALLSERKRTDARARKRKRDERDPVLAFACQFSDTVIHLSKPPSLPRLVSLLRLLHTGDPPLRQSTGSIPDALGNLFGVRGGGGRQDAGATRSPRHKIQGLVHSNFRSPDARSAKG